MDTYLLYNQSHHHLYDDKKQIIISSDSSPDDLKHLEDRLRTRFNWGLKVNIFPPDNDLRREILRKKRANMDFSRHISDDAIDYIENMKIKQIKIQ